MLRSGEEITKRFLKTITFLCVVIAMFTTLFLKGRLAEAASLQRFSSYHSNAGAPPSEVEVRL